LANTFPPFPSDLRFGSYLVYPNRRATEQAADPSSANACRNLILAVKRDAVSPQDAPRTLIGVWIRKLATVLQSTILASLLDRSATLVPMPRSSPLLPRSVWPALRLAEAMVDQGLGAEVMPCLRRIKVVPKSAFSGPGARPTALDHYRSLAVELLPGIPDRVILIDDVVTQGSMFCGGYAKLAEVLHGAEIVAAFAFARTVQSFTRAVDPCVGRITCGPAGTPCTRTP
jgi:hypothetical protein